MRGCTLIEQNLRHHAFIFMRQQVTVEDRHAADDRIGEVNDQIDCASIWNVDSV